MRRSLGTDIAWFVIKIRFVIFLLNFMNYNDNILGVIDEPVAGGRLALTLSLRALGTSAACIARTLFCVKWSLRAMFLALPVAVIQLLLYPDR